MQTLIQKLKKLFKEESGDEMRERINRQNREYNATGITSIKFYKGAWYE
jgi:predicted amidohydrolase YtcJ